MRNVIFAVLLTIVLMVALYFILAPKTSLAPVGDISSSDTVSALTGE